MTPTEHLTELYYQHHQEDNPNFPAQYIPKPDYKLDTTNGMTRAIVDFIRWSGGYAERINTTGRVIKAKSGKEIYIPTAGTRGSADISAIVNGRAVRIEVKCRKTRDRIRPDQEQYAEKVTRAGAVYFVARSFDEFYEWYKNLTI